MQTFKEHLFKIISEAGPTGICLEFQLLVGLGWIIRSPREFKSSLGQPSETLPQNQIETYLEMWSSGGVLALQGGSPQIYSPEQNGPRLLLCGVLMGKSRRD